MQLSIFMNMVWRKIVKNWRIFSARYFSEKMTKSTSNQEVFSTIYRQNRWGNWERSDNFYSGPGSYGQAADIYVEMMVNFIEQHNISSMLDLGCGDFNIGNKITQALPNLNYIGVDVVPELISHHTQKYGRQNVRFQTIDAVQDDLPDAQLIAIRQVLQHLNNQEIIKIIPKLSKFQYNIITEHLPTEDNSIPNLDKPTSWDIRLKQNSGVFIEKPPFNMTIAETLLHFKDPDVGGYIVTHLVKNF
ncbi:MAG: class I SAM-dependent methyltransferase [Saprospiraceae bacterium]|nr:class I SAM-dependent methyltransferase [Saprospiraceae bacterium]MBP7699751.1 class I SAM-dependent methyltransferase [Saprospiraceae bacterium]